MSIIQRPGKEGNATTYQGKVAAGYTKILASEVDLDIDTIYTAWNSGTDTVNIKDLAVTTPKLAEGAVTQSKLAAGVNATGNAGGDLSGTYPNPALGIVQAGHFGVNPRLQVVAGPTYTDIQANSAAAPGYDNTKSSWLLRTDYVNDVVTLFRAPAGSGTYAAAWFMNGKGFVTNPAWAGALYNAGPFGPIPSGISNAEMTLPTVWYDNGSGIASASTNHLITPTFPGSGGMWCMINAACDISVNQGFGFAVVIQQFASGAWQTIRQSLLNAAVNTSFSCCALWPLSSNIPIRLAVTNATGVSVTVSWASLQLAVLGQ